LTIAFLSKGNDINNIIGIAKRLPNFVVKLQVDV
jgi:hypothetical protein